MGRIGSPKREVQAWTDKGKPVQVDIREMMKRWYKWVQDFVNILNRFSISQHSTESIEQTEEDRHLNH